MHITVSQGFSNGGAADHFAIYYYRRHHGNAEVLLAPHFAERIGVALPFSAQGEVRPDYHSTYAQVFLEQADEVACT